MTERMTERTYDNKWKSRLVKSLYFLGIMGLLMICMMGNTMKTQAATKLKLKYDGKWHTYKDVQPKLYVDGKKTACKDVPIVKLNKNLMVPIDKLTKAMGASYTIRSGVITISWGTETLGTTKTLQMTQGEKKATLNGKKTYTMKTYPRVVKNKATKKKIMMVPVAFVAKKMGYSYSYSASSKKIQIHTLIYMQKEVSIDKSVYRIPKKTEPDNTPAPTDVPGSAGSETNVPGTAEGTPIVPDSEVGNSTESSGENQTEDGEPGTGNTTDTGQTDAGFLYIQSVYKWSATYTKNKGYEYFKIYSTDAAQTAAASVNVDADTRKVTILYPSTYNGFGSVSGAIKRSNHINTYSAKQLEDGTTEITVTYRENSQAYVSTAGTVTTINFLPLQYSLFIPKAEDMVFSEIKDSDEYHNKRFTITIKGDYTAFFKKNPIRILSKNIKSAKVSLNSAGNTKITVKTTKIQGYKLYDQGDTIVVDVNNPSKIYDKIVVLDPGHGGKDPGAKSRGTNEKDLNFKILYTYGKTYFKDSDIKVYYTRVKDSYVPLYDLAAFSKKVEADMYVSLHMNSASSSAAKGTEVYYSKTNKTKWSSGLTSKVMAKKFLKNVRSAMGTVDRGVRTANFVVVKANTVPAVLIELGFISSNSDYKKLTNTTYQKKAANAIATSIKQLFKKYETDRE